MSDYNNGRLQDPCLRLDYGFGEQWASVELGDGTGYVRLADYEKVVAENAKLQSERDYLLANSNPTATELRRVRSAWKKDRDENAKLREQVVQLKNDCESERDYADQMEANEKRAVSENSKLRVENVKLRELVRKYGEYTDQDRCDGCVCKSRCNDGDVDECWQLTEIRGLARELGIEVGP